MQIKLPAIDLKLVSRIGSVELKDDAGKEVGQYFFGKGHGRTVLLFGKYRGSYKSHAECQAFIEGVLAVLNPDLGSGAPDRAQPSPH